MADDRKPWQHDKRSRHERGYGHAWETRRAAVLKRDGYLCRCDVCQRSGALKPATEVDHILSKDAWLRERGSLDGVDDWANLQAINHDCHERKTARELGRVVRAGADAAGLPLDPGHPWNRRS